MSFHALIGQELSLTRVTTRNDLMVAQFVFLLNAAQFSKKNFNGKINVLTNKWNVKKTLQLNHSHAAHVSTWVLNILMSFLWLIKLETMENCCRSDVTTGIKSLSLCVHVVKHSYDIYQFVFVTRSFSNLRLNKLKL